MGIAPPHGSHAALPIACDALNARTVAVRKYHCIFCVSSPASRYTCFPARCWSLGCPGGDNLTRIASWRTRRMARRKRNVSDLPYAAPPLSCAAFFVKVQNGFALSRFRMALLPRQQRNGKGGERKRPAAAAVYSSALKVRTAIISFACSRSRMSWSTPK